MKVLIYGGCHAGALKRIFDRHALGDHRFDTLTNFQLIASKTPFPYDTLPRYDLVIFNPILNKEDWNTSHLEAACQRVNVPFLKYPWLQWGGYWPMPGRRHWGKLVEWTQTSALSLTGALDAPRDAAGFERFYAALFEPRHFAAAMTESIDSTTKQLRMREQTSAVDVTITDFILDNYRRAQLFLTPDHPTNALYAHLVRRLATLAGIPLDPAYGTQRIEVQEGVRTPILPGVGEAIGLGFSSTDWSHHVVLGPSHYSLRDWALSSFPGMGVKLGIAKMNTRVKPLGTEEGDGIAFPRNRRVLLTDLSDAAPDQHWSGRLLGSEHGSAERGAFYRAHWDMLDPGL